LALSRLLRPHCAAVLHVRDINLDYNPNTSIWRYAKQYGYDVLTNDKGFVRSVLAEGFLPRVVSSAKRTGASEDLGRVSVG